MNLKAEEEMSKVNGTHLRQQPAVTGEDGRSIAILYGSETGNGEEIAAELGGMAERLHFRTVVEEMNNFKLKNLFDFSLVIFVTSTTGQGEMPANASRFWRNLLRQSLTGTNCLARLRFAVFGLGDSSYPKFNWAARKLRRRLLQLGAREFFKEGEADERHDDGIDSIYLPWFQELRDMLVAAYLPDSVRPIPDDTQRPPKFSLRLAPSHITKGAFSPDDLIPGPSTFKARLVFNKRMTPDDHWQDVRLLSFDIEPGENGSLPELTTGATLDVFPKNSPEDVRAIIDLMGWGPVADEPLEWSPSPQASTRTSTSRGRLPQLSPHHRGRPSLRDLLTHHFDIASVPKRSFFAQLAFFATESHERERLAELSSPANRQEFYDYATRPRRTILEALRDFPSLQVPLAWCIDLFPVIRGREFSVAGGGTRTPSASDQGDPLLLRDVQILAALVEYQTIIRKPRQGLCSRYLKQLREETWLRVGLGIPAPDKSISPLPPPPPPPTPSGSVTFSNRRIRSHIRPLIAVATGTGIAPIRCLLHEREALRRAGHGNSGPTLLFYGCRSEHADFYFRDEWETIGEAGGLQVHAAFSRDPVPAELAGTLDASQPSPVPPATVPASAPTPPPAASYDAGKNYVQHYIRRQYRRVCELMRDFPLVVVCGNAGRMPTSVRAALQDALVLGGVVAGGTEEAERWLEDEGNLTFWQETW